MLKYFDDLYYEETEQLINMRRFFIKKLNGDYKRALDVYKLHIKALDEFDEILKK